VGDFGVDWRKISKLITDFMLSRWLITDVNPVLGLLHRVAVGNVADVSEVLTASIFTLRL
jgi:hypothetical protein